MKVAVEATTSEALATRNQDIAYVRRSSLDGSTRRGVSHKMDAIRRRSIHRCMRTARNLPYSPLTSTRNNDCCMVHLDVSLASIDTEMDGGSREDGKTTTQLTGGGGGKS